MTTDAIQQARRLTAERTVNIPEQTTEPIDTNGFDTFRYVGKPDDMQVTFYAPATDGPGERIAANVYLTNGEHRALALELLNLDEQLDTAAAALKRWDDDRLVWDADHVANALRAILEALPR